MREVNNEPQNKKILGRGLGSLFGENHTGLPVESLEKPKPALEIHQMPEPKAQGQVSTEGRVWNVGIDKLRPSPYQPRTQFQRASLEELAQSIKTSGILQPIIVRKNGEHGFEIVAGERRWRSAQLAGMHEVPVIIKAFSDRETLELALIENIQRQDLNPIEESEAYQRLGHEFQLTQQQIAEKVGRDRATVANAIRLLQLPLEVRNYIGENKLSVGHAKVLLAVPDPVTQKKLADRIIKESITVRKLEKLIKKPVAEAATKSKPEVTTRLIQGLSEEMQKILGTKVTIDYHEGKGKLGIHFYSDEQLTSVVDRIKEGCQK